MIDFLKNIKNFQTDRYGFKVNEPRVDYCLLVPDDTPLIVWYDSDDGITFKFIDNEYKYDIFCSAREQVVRVIKYNINIDKKYTRTISYVNHGDLDEETFFMNSTIENYGEISFEMYKEIQRIYDDVMVIICDLEDSYDK